MTLWLLLLVQDYSIDRKWEGKGSKIETPGVQLITGAGAWRRFWERHTGKEGQVPEVDFAKLSVLAVFPDGRFHSIFSSAASDGKRVTVTVVVGMKNAAEYVPHYCILALPKTALPIRVLVRQNTCTGIDEARDRTYDVETICGDPNRCTRAEGCVECGAQAADSKALCEACAEKTGGCPRCGRPRR